MKTQTILFLLILVTLISCNSKKEADQTETAFSDLAKKYSTLKIPDDSLYSNYYTRLTSIENHPLKLKFEVFRKNNDKESFVLTVKYKNKMRAIPIFPYSEACYWNYENERNKCGSSILNFQYEYNKMLKDLSLDDSSNLAYHPYFIIINNILLLETMKLSDSTVVLTQHEYCNATEDAAFALNRNKKNVSRLMGLIQNEHYLSFLAVRDYEFDHVFWGEPKRKKDGKMELVFKAFNFECIEPPLLEM